MDNYGWGEPGCYGGGILRGAPTPNIDELAAQGMQLLNFNVEAQCTPSRAAILTGRYAIRTGNGSIPIESPVYGLTQWEYTMAEMFSDKGYSTAMYGKWHLGHTEGPLSYESKALMNGMASRIPVMKVLGPMTRGIARTPIHLHILNTSWRPKRMKSRQN